MATLYFANHQIIVLRSRRRGVTDKYTMSATFTVMPADIQPASPVRTEFVNGRPGHVFTGFLSTDYLVLEGDRLVVIGTNGARDKTYEVRGVSYWQGVHLDHQELDLVDEVA